MKKERFFNSYLYNNLAVSKTRVAFVQLIERDSNTHESVIRIVSYSQLNKVALAGQKPQSTEKEFLAYDPVGPDDLTLTFQEDTRATVYGLCFVASENDEQLFVTTSSGLYVFYQNLQKSTNFHKNSTTKRLVFTGLAFNSPNVYASHYNGVIEKVVHLVRSSHQARLYQISTDRP